MTNRTETFNVDLFPSMDIILSNMMSVCYSLFALVFCLTESFARYEYNKSAVALLVPFGHFGLLTILLISN